jgi:hypothetical protein
MTSRPKHHNLKVWLVAIDIFCALLAAYLLHSHATGHPAEGPPPGIRMTPDEAERRLVELRAEIDRLQQQLEELLVGQADLDPAAVREAIASLSERLKERQAEVESLEEQIARAKRALDDESDEKVKGSVEELKARAKELKAQLHQLEDEEAKLQARLKGSSEEGGVPVPHQLKGMPVYFALVKNRVVPIREPYYTFRTDFERTIVTRDQREDGDSATKAIVEGGCLHDLLVREDNKTTYVKFFVCADSVAAFQTASRAVQALGFAWSWCPYDESKPLVGSSGRASDWGTGGRRGHDHRRPGT